LTTCTGTERGGLGPSQRLSTSAAPANSAMMFFTDSTMMVRQPAYDRTRRRPAAFLTGGAVASANESATQTVRRSVADLFGQRLRQRLCVEAAGVGFDEPASVGCRK
jgi:hypothetical protein